jgi:tape measure domain-containing protein
MASQYDILISLKAQNQASAALKAVAGDLGALERAAAAPITAVGGLVTALGHIGFAAQGIQTLLAPLQGLSQGVVTAASSTESFRVGIDRMAGSVQQADAFIHDLVRFAAQTPFELSGLQDQTRRLAAVGFSLNEVIPLLRITGDAVAALGGSSEQLDRVTLALGQMHTRGKVSMQELNQLAEAGIPAFRLLAEGFGVTQAQMAKMIESGTVPADKSIRILLEGMQKLPGAMGAMDAQSQTLAGRLSNLQDAVYQLQAGIGGALGDALKVAITGLGELVQNVQQIVVPVLQRYGPQIAAAVGPVVAQGVALATQAMTTFVGVVVGAGPSLARAVGAIAGVFQTGLSATLSVVVTMAQAIYGALQYLNPFARHSPSLVESVETGVDAIGEAFGGLSGPVVAAVAGARTAMEGFRDTVGDVSGRLGDQLPKSLSAAIALLGQGARPAFLEMQRAIEDANAALDDQKAALADQKAALGPYKDAVDAAKAAVQDQQRALRDLRGTLKDQQDALAPLKAQYDDLTQAVKDADAAIRDLQSTPVAGTAEFERRTTEATNAVRAQEKALNDLKRSDAYRTLADQIDAAERRIKDAQLAPEPKRTGDTERDKRDAQARADALDDQRRALELLKRRQEDLLTPAQRELENRKSNLEAIRLEKATAIDAAEDRIKIAAQEAKGVKERGENEITAALGAARANKANAETQLRDVEPAYRAQQAAIEGTQDAIREQEKAVASAQDAVTEATRAYDDQKAVVDDLQRSYAAAKTEVAGFEAELRQTIATARQAAQAQAEAAAAAKKTAADAKKAAKDAALDAPGPAGGIVPPGTVGVPKETQQQLDALKQSADGFAKSVDDARKSAEDFGKGIEAAAKRAQSALTDLGERFGPVVKLIQENAVPAFAAVATLMGTLWVNSMRVAALSMGPVLVELAPLILTVGALTAAAFLLTKAWTENWGDIQGKTAAAWEFLGPILAGLGDALHTLLEGLLPALAAAFTTAWQAIQAVVGGVWGFLSTEVFPPLMEALGWFTVTLLPEFQATWDAISNKVTEVWTWLWPTLLQPGMAELSKDWAEKWTAAQTLFAAVWEAIRVVVATVWPIVEGIILGGLKLVRGDWEGAWDAIRDGFAAAWEEIQKTVGSLVQGVLDALGQLARDAGEAAGNVGRSIADAMLDALKDLGNSLKSAIEGAVKGALDAAANAIRSFKPPSISVPGVAGRGGGELAADLPPISPGILGLPLRGPISQGYGQTQFSREYPQFYAGAGHDGVDIVAPVGTPVGASGVGRVTKAGFDRTGYGNLVEIVHNGISTFYGHLDSIRVAIGQIVAAGEVIGTVGMTGNTTGPHLHLGAKDHGRSVDPRSVIAFATGGLIREPVVGVGKSGRLYTLGEHESEQTAVVPSSAFRRPGSGSGRAPAGADYAMDAPGIDYDKLAAAIVRAQQGQTIQLHVQGAEDLVVWGTVTAQRRGRLP